MARTLWPAVDMQVHIDLPEGSFPEISVIVGGQPVMMNELSSGQLWVLTTAILLVAGQEHDGRPMLVLLDEPGSHMHLSAVQTIRQALLRLSEVHQVVYTTHNDHLVSQAPPGSLRIARRRRQVITCVAPSDITDEDSLSELLPLLYAKRQELLEVISKNENLLIVEGQSEHTYLTMMRTLVDPTGQLMPADVRVIDAETIGIIDKLVKLCPFSCNVTVLMDSNPDDQSVRRAKEKVEDVLAARGKHEMILHPTGERQADIEDTFQREEFLRLAERALGVPFGTIEVPEAERLTPQLDGWLRRQGRQGKHGSLARPIAALARPEDLRRSTESFESLLRRIGEAFQGGQERLG
ncbi:ATP-dependent endonuclease [Deinococcus malanensis]